MARDTAGAGATILMVEDDPAVAELMADVLESSAYRVQRAEGGGEAKAMLDQVHPNLIILDLMLPDADGLVLCADLRQRADIPIIICSATPEKRDSILAFKLGADDFIPKPFVVEELVARVQAVLRRSGQGDSRRAAEPAPPPAAPPSQPPQARVDRVGELTVDHSRRHVQLGSRDIVLTPTEYRLLTALLSRPDEVLSRRELAQVVWGSAEASVGRSIDVHVHRLRAKLREAQEETGLPAPRVVAIRGFGYKLVRPPPESNTPAPADA